MRASTEENPGWSAPARISVTKCAKNVRKECKVQKTSLGKKCPVKAVALAVKLTEKPGKSKSTKGSQGGAQSWWRRSRA